ncbi:MAG: M23 family metallopeptidase [Acidobacteria bacterium]|nr:M23 family metallopeptidase [Acidobacteriota bacterium]
MRRFSARAALATLFISSLASAVSIRESSTAAAVSESSCAVTGPSNTFRTDQGQIFFRFLARDVRASDQLRVDWLNPGGQVELSTPWSELPGAKTLCFLTQMPLAGFPAAAKPGVWTVQVVVNSHVAHSHAFQLEGDPNASSVLVSSVTLHKAAPEQTEFILAGTGFEIDSVTHIAQFTPEGNWEYLFATLPSNPGSNEIRFTHANLPPGEYLAVIRNPDGRLSVPARFVIATGREYKMPVPEGAPWVITQGPHGSFSHWNNSKHAWDIAPRGDRHIVAMRAGTVYTHDLGLHQTQAIRSFGNFITIDHGDGEFSHYAHLATGSFLVRNGQHVEQGQPLARAGNSGYTFGQGGGYHLHVHVTNSPRIAAPSIPFEFGDLRGIRRLARSGR